MSEPEDDEPIDPLPTINAWLRNVDDVARRGVSLAEKLLTEVPRLTTGDVEWALNDGGDDGPLADNAIIAAEQVQRLASVLVAIAYALDRRGRPGPTPTTPTPTHLN